MVYFIFINGFLSEQTLKEYYSVHLNNLVVNDFEHDINLYTYYNVGNSIDSLDNFDYFTPDSAYNTVLQITCLPKQVDTFSEIWKEWGIKALKLNFWYKSLEPHLQDDFMNLLLENPNRMIMLSPADYLQFKIPREEYSCLDFKYLHQKNKAIIATFALLANPYSFRIPIKQIKW
jgi:hypothetical protein